MDDITYRKAKALKDILTSSLFPEIMHQVVESISMEIYNSASQEKDKREALYGEFRALNRLVGRLQALANDVTATEMKKEKSNG
jgi:hypothetical protein